jgi:hypothetical protein
MIFNFRKICNLFALENSDGTKTRNPGEENTESGDDFPGGIQNFRRGSLPRFRQKSLILRGQSGGF